MSTLYPFDAPVPFAPMPEQHVAMKHYADRDWTFDSVPLMEVARECFRDCAFDLGFGHDEQARERAQLGRQLEQAYLTRCRAQTRAESERSAAAR